MDPRDITVLVPTRNEARNLPAFLGSMPAGMALIVVDDSRDGSADLVSHLRPENSRVVRSQASVARARQIGAELAETPWLLFADADIVFGAAYFDQLRRLPPADAYYGPKLSLDRYHRYYATFSACQRLAHRLGFPAVSGSNFLVRRSSFEAVGGFDLGLSCNEDSELGWRIGRAGYRIAWVPELVVYARDHRRLDRGLTLKTLHSIVRCSLLYANLLPSRLRHHDWGYWRTTAESPRSYP